MSRVLALLPALGVSMMLSVPKGPYARHQEIIAAVGDGEFDVFILGDSIAERWPADAWPHGEVILNAGLSGDSTNGMRWRLAHGVLPSQAGRVLVVGGINDLQYGVEPLEVATNLVGLDQELRMALPAAHLQVLGLLPTARVPQAKVDEVNWLLGQELPRDLVVVQAVVETVDGLHPSVAGYATIMAELGE